MPLVGETVGSSGAFTTGVNPYSTSWDLDFPAGRKLVKVAITEHAEFGSRGTSLRVALLRIRRQPVAGGPEETVNFPSIPSFNQVVADYDTRMTHVRIGLQIRRAQARVIWSLGHWA